MSTAVTLFMIMENPEMMYIRIIVIACVITGLVQTSSYAGCDCDDWMQKGGYCVDYIKTKIPTFAIPKSVHELETLKNKNIFEVTAGDVAIFELSDRWHVAYVENVHSDRFGLATSIDVTEMNFGQQLSFGASSGSVEQPVVFKMWSNKIHEKLISGGKSFEIVPDGRAYFINLTDDTISESAEGDLKVWIQCSNQPVRGQLYDWSAGIEVINGGLLEESLGSAMYEAPTEGYVPSFQLSGQIKGGQRGDIGERQFYLKLKNEQEYGQMSIGLYAPFNDQIPGLIRLSYVINPSGSRILR